MAESLAEVVVRVAEHASTRTLVTCALAGLVALVSVLFLALFGRGGQWLLPVAATSVAAVAFGLGGLAHQALRDERTQPLPDHARLSALRLVERAAILCGAAGAVVGAGRVLMGLYGSSFWN
jgi:hypothetical protein